LVIISPSILSGLVGQKLGDQIFCEKSLGCDLSPAISGPLLPEVPAEFRGLGSVQHLFHPADLLGKGYGLAVLKFSQVYQLPLDAWQFRGMRTAKQAPVGLGTEQAQKKVFLIASEAIHQFGSKAGTGFYQFLQGHWNRRHPGELLCVDLRDVLVSGIQNLVGRSIVSAKINDEAFDHIVRESLGFEQAMDIEQVPRMLAVESSHKFASV